MRSRGWGRDLEIGADARGVAAQDDHAVGHSTASSILWVTTKMLLVGNFLPSTAPSAPRAGSRGEHVERREGSSINRISGSTARRAQSHALPHAAGELLGVAVSKPFNPTDANWAHGPRYGACRAAPAGHAPIGVGGVERLRNGVSQGALRRHAAARGIRARPGRGARDPVHGRAVLGARRAHRREPPRRAAGAVDRQENPHQEHLRGDPQHRGSRAAGRPGHRAGPQPRAHPRRFPDPPAPAAQPQLRRISAVRRLHL